MLDKLKQFKELHDMQKALKAERIEVEIDNNKMVMNGNMDVLEVNISDETFQKGKAETEEMIIKLHEDALKKVQQAMASKMGGLGGLM